MKILAIYRHYWPDTTPYARLLRAILEEQVKQGHTVSVLAAQPSYNDISHSRQPRRETIEGVDIRRIRLLPERKHLRLLRGLNFVYFLFRAVFHAAFHKKFDLIVANTHPPVLMGMALRVIKWLSGTEFLLHCQDIHPESAELGNQLRQRWLVRWLTRADSKSCRSAIRVVTLSEDMLRTLQQRAEGPAGNIEVINNFPLDVYESPASLPKIFEKNQSDVFRILFAGNMGLFQDLSRLVEAARVLRNNKDIHFIFMGAGADLKSLKQIAGDLIGETVFFESFQPVEVAFGCMQRANLGVVSLKQKVCQVAYPSKTMTYLAAGCPLLLIAERECQLANDIVSHEFGYVPTRPKAPQIAETILEAQRQGIRWTSEAREALSRRSKNYFGRERTLANWNTLFAKIDVDLAAKQSQKQSEHRHQKAA